MPSASGVVVPVVVMDVVGEVVGVVDGQLSICTHVCDTTARQRPLHTSVNSTTEELQSVQTTLLPPPSHSQLTAFPSNAGVVEAEVVPEVVPVVLEGA